MESLLAAYRRLSAGLGRVWALASGSATLSEVQRMEARFYEEVRVYIAKFNAEEDRNARGELHIR